MMDYNKLVDMQSTGLVSSEAYLRDAIVLSVLHKYKMRSNKGVEKYNTTLAENELSLEQWLLHLQEELMDATLYVEKMIDELRSKENSVEQGSHS
jgi:hypothetical protein